MTRADFHHLLSQIRALPPGQMRQLRRQLDQMPEPAPSARKPMTRDEFHRHLIEIGLMSQLPDTAADFDVPDDEPIPIKGEPLSETVIRERR